jgi:hypothetical protein
MHENLDVLPPALRALGVDLDRAMREAEQSVPAGRARRLRGLAWPAALAAAVAVFFGVGLPDHNGSLTSQVPVADALERAAQAALSAPSLMPRDDQYFYVRSEGTQLEGGAGGVIALETKTDSRWISADRPNVSESKLISISYPAPRDRHALGSATRPALPSPLQLPPRHGYQIGEHLLTRAQVLSYPTEPHAIYRRLYADTHGGSRIAAAEHVFSEIAETLSSDPMPAALRSGFYRALALVPGLHLTPNVHDAKGRVGVGASIIRAGVQEEVIFDPATAEMLEERKVILNPRLAGLTATPGMVINDTTYLGWAITNTAPRGTPLLGEGNFVGHAGKDRRAASDEGWLPTSRPRRPR